MATRRKKKESDAAKIRALVAEGKSKEDILAKGFTRQQWEGALAHTKPMGRPRKPRCPLCGHIIAEEKEATTNTSPRADAVALAKKMSREGVELSALVDEFQTLLEQRDRWRRAYTQAAEAAGFEKETTHG